MTTFWKFNSSIVLWALWTSRRRRIFQEIQWNVVDVVKEIWLTLMHTLKGEYDAIKGDSNAVFRKQEVFKKRWERMNVFFMVMVVYIGGVNHLFGYFLLQHEACGHVQLFLAMLWEICMFLAT